MYFRSLFLPRKVHFHIIMKLLFCLHFCINCGKCYYMLYLFDVYGLQTDFKLIMEVLPALSQAMTVKIKWFVMMIAQ